MTESELGEALGHLCRKEASPIEMKTAKELLRLRQAERDWADDTQSLLEAASLLGEESVPVSKALMVIIPPIRDLKIRLDETDRILKQRQAEPKAAAQGTS